MFSTKYTQLLARSRSKDALHYFNMVCKILVGFAGRFNTTSFAAFEVGPAPHHAVTETVAQIIQRGL